MIPGDGNAVYPSVSVLSHNLIYLSFTVDLICVHWDFARFYNVVFSYYLFGLYLTINVMYLTPLYLTYMVKRVEYT